MNENDVIYALCGNVCFLEIHARLFNLGEAVNTFGLMEDINDKLKILNYEVLF